MDDYTWSIRYLVGDTENRWVGKALPHVDPRFERGTGACASTTDNVNAN